uniref:TF-B3 domain-containing protein n=1 Tax=Solanum tuberosum TaxID=4113 RepID=M1DZJ7_SOLTU
MQRIPEEFARRCCKNMLNPVYLEVPSGQVWEVEVQHSEGQIWLAKGWEDFCDYYSISCGHFLMFGYNAHSCFDVTIFDLSATEIEYPYSLRTFHCHETHHVLKSDLSESDDYVYILEDIPRSQKLNEKVPDMVDHSVENLGDGQSSKRKRDEEDVASPSFTRKGQCEDLIGYDLNSMSILLHNN